ncbi:hypothetical protein niasHT_035349 [Heterodera trifolii]|uniref:MULE transposase domain-containing protein n=1 Tax=Heterodera trifolii TaxID=157864 RepID=A0ABD2IA92_9BILA
MDRKKIEILQKCRKRKFLDNNDNENEGNSEHREQNAENDRCDDDSEEEQAIINFELGKTQKGGICLWSEGGKFARELRKVVKGFRYTHEKNDRWRCTVRSCHARVTIADKSDSSMSGFLGQKEHNHLPEPPKQNAEIRRQKILECVKAEPRIKPTRLLAEVRRSTADETYVAMGSDNALSCLMRRQKRKILGNVDCADPMAFVIPDKLRLKNGEDIVLYDSRTVRIGEKDVVLVFGSERTLDILSKNNATWHLDGTFKAAPTIWEQCFVVGASVNHRMCIGVWGLLPGKHRRYYEEVLNFLRTRTSPSEPRKVICDFEKAEMNAVSAVFPAANILCCMFHYGQNLYRKIKKLKLVQMYGEQSVRVRHAFRNVLSLPLLPPTYVRRAFSVIVGIAPMEMEQFLLYFARNYIGMTQRQLLDGANAFGVRPAFAGTSFSSVESDHTYSRQPLQFGIDSPAPSTLSWPSTVEQNSPLVQYSLSPSSTTTLQPARPWEEPVVRRALFPIPYWNVHSHAASALARTNNGLEATHLHFSKGLCHHPALSDFISEVSRSIDRQVDAARSARNFIHKRYVLQDAVIMRILADATYNNDAEIHDVMTALGLQVEGYAGKLKDYENTEDSIMDVA